MTLKAWRLVKWKHAPDAFSGEGNRLYGGRWTSPGRRAVYVSESQALSALETIAHFPPGRTPPAYGFISVLFDSGQVDRLSVTLPPNWASMPAATAASGDGWLANPKSSCVLAIPTALVPEGTNYIINPMHLDFKRLSIGQAIVFAFDPRIPSPALSP